MDILFITHNRLGDAVLSSGLYGHLAERHPEARITVACGPVPAPLFAEAPNLATIVELHKQPYLGHWRELWQHGIGRRWQLIVDLRGSAIAWLLRAGQRRVLRPPTMPMHRVVMLGALLDLSPPPAPRLWVEPAQRQRAEQLIPGDRPLLALGPTANWGGKQWPGDRFAALAKRLTADDGALPGARIAVFGAPQEREAAAPTVGRLPAEARLDLVGKVDLPTLYACLQRCQLFVGNDSGLMHMAAAADIPTLGLFGPSREALYAPWGPRAAAVRTPESFEEITGHPAYDYRRHESWMTSLSVDRVAQAATELLHRTAAEAA